MKKSLLTLAIMLLAVAAQAQIKVHNDNWVSIGCLNGNYGLQVTPSGYTYFRSQDSNHYSWANKSMSNDSLQQHWIVENQYLPDSLGKHVFYVLGKGHVYSKGYHIITKNMDNRFIRGEIEPVDSRYALESILKINGYYYGADSNLSPEDIENNEYIDETAVEGMLSDLEKRSVGLSGENVAEALPEAVRTDPEARLCIDLQAVVSMLIEAVKEQQSEIETLRNVLEENGLMRK